MMAKYTMRSKVLLLAFLVIAGIGVFHFSHRRPVMFSIEAISSDLSFDPRWQTPSPSPEIREIFSQKFSYLARGAQSFAFLSEDGRYVVKFFRMRHLQSKFKDHFRPGVVKRRAENLQAIFFAHKLAWDVLKEETGLVFLHLNKTDDLHCRLKVRDWLGRSHEVDLDNTEFVVQERADLIFTRIKQLHAQGDQQGVERALRSFMQLVRTQIERGVFDRDKAITHNYGFVGDRPIHLDIGRLAQGEKAGEYERIKARLEKWLQENGITISGKAEIF